MRNWIIFALASLGISSLAVAQIAKPAQHGSEPYTPTKLEWLAMELNAISSIRNAEGGLFLTTKFFPDHTNDAIVVHVNYTENVERRHINQAAESARSEVARLSKARGWSWIQTREATNLIKP